MVYEAGYLIRLGAMPYPDGTKSFCAVATDVHGEEFISVANSPFDAALGLTELVGIDLNA